jgi:hypothetical protein
VQIVGRLGQPASTVHAALVRCRINRLSRIDRLTGEPLRRYEQQRPGSLIHVDVTTFGNIPAGGGWRYVGKQPGGRNRAAIDAQRRKGQVRGPVIGAAVVHTVIDDCSRVAYAEICADETADTAIAVLRRAIAWFTDRGVAEASPRGERRPHANASPTRWPPDVLWSGNEPPPTVFRHDDGRGRMPLDSPV